MVEHTPFHYQPTYMCLMTIYSHPIVVNLPIKKTLVARQRPTNTNAVPPNSGQQYSVTTGRGEGEGRRGLRYNYIASTYTRQ